MEKSKGIAHFVILVCFSLGVNWFVFSCKLQCTCCLIVYVKEKLVSKNVEGIVFELLLHLFL